MPPFYLGYSSPVPFTTPEHPNFCVHFPFRPSFFHKQNCLTFDKTFKSPLIELMIENKRAGEKNSKGYYIYDEKRRARPTLEVKKIIEQARKFSKIMFGGKPIVVTDREILEMIFFPVVNETCRVLDEEIAIKASDLDVSSVLGMGFLAYKGGIVFFGRFCWCKAYIL